MTAHEMEFCLLGPLTVSIGGVPLPALPGKQRVVLATLLLKPNSLVSLDELVEAIWGDYPPASAHGSIRNYVKSLRKALAGCGDSRITTVPGGYAIRIVHEELDVTRFASFYEAGRVHADAGAWREAASVLRSGLSLWRGEPLADVPSQWLALREVPRLTELRLQAFEARCAADLQVGRHGEVVADLHQVIALHPLRERLHALLMLALYRNGQQAESLAAYQRARTLLLEELATEPGAELRLLQQRILVADPALTRPGSLAAASADSEHVAPRELPASVRHFTGRTAELAALSDLVVEADGRALVICAVGGTAGVGKTALSVQWAHQVAQQFPDGQLYANMRGYDLGDPVAATDALAGFLGALGVPGQEIPDGVADRARLYRSMLAGRRVLVLLDNARDAEQVRPLLPGDQGCVAIVTSRDTMAGLVVTDGALRLDLDVLPLTDAIELLRSLIGTRADHHPEATAELARLCARLPLALRIAAELVATRRTAPLTDLVAELAVRQLDCLAAGEDRADMRVVFSWSFRQLPRDAAEAFALLGLHPGEDLDAQAAAALTGRTVSQARRILDRLHRASLLQANGTGRYGMHDLLRVYAREQAAALDGHGQSGQAMTRLFDYYLATAAAARDILFPAQARPMSRIPRSAATPLVMSGEADARAWLDRERANLTAMVVHGAGHGWPGHATSLARTLFRYLMNGSHLPEADTIYTHALHAARQSGDVAAEANALNGLGSIGLMKGHFGDAAGHYQMALERYRQCRDLEGEVRVLRNLGLTELQLQNHASAAGYYRQVIAACEDMGDSHGAAGALVYLASAETELGSHDQASEHLQRALPVLREAKDHVGEAEALMRIGELSLSCGKLAQAVASFEDALSILSRIDNPAGIAAALGKLGDVSLCQGEPVLAISYLRQALNMFRQVGHQHGEIMTLFSLAEALRSGGQHAAARAELTAALRLAVESGNVYLQANAHRELAECHQNLDEDEQARQHWQQALTLYGQLGAPEADLVRSRLSAQDATAQH